MGIARTSGGVRDRLLLRAYNAAQDAVRRIRRMLKTPTLHVARDRFHLAWGPAIPAIETVPDGAVVEFDLLDADGR